MTVECGHRRDAGVTDHCHVVVTYATHGWQAGVARGVALFPDIGVTPVWRCLGTDVALT